MATNPMKRRERNSFLIGFIIALLIMGGVVAVMYSLYSKKSKELEQIVAKQVQVLVAKDDIESAKPLEEDDFILATVMTTLDSEEYYTYPDEMFKEMKDDSNEMYELELEAKIAIPAGTIVTKNMVQEVENKITSDMRIQEYNTFVLPSQLDAGDFIDIRLTLPTGQDYIVLSKKEVIQADDTTVWLKVNETEIQLLNSAMVETWAITGTKLYAIEYIEAGMQNSAAITYQPSGYVFDLIEANPNITKEAHDKLAQGLNSLGKSEFTGSFRDYIDKELEKYTDEERASSVESGFSDEITKIKEHRSKYIDSLNGKM